MLTCYMGSYRHNIEQFKLSVSRSGIDIAKNTLFENMRFFFRNEIVFHLGMTQNEVLETKLDVCNLLTQNIINANP